MDGYDDTTIGEDDTTANDSEVEVGVPVQPVQAKGLGDVRKMVPTGAPTSERVVPNGGAMVQDGAPAGGAQSGASGGDSPKKGKNSQKRHHFNQMVTLSKRMPLLNKRHHPSSSRWCLPP
jgi:hypothetical protein